MNLCWQKLGERGIQLPKEEKKYWVGKNKGPFSKVFKFWPFVVVVKFPEIELLGERVSICLRLLRQTFPFVSHTVLLICTPIN